MAKNRIYVTTNRECEDHVSGLINFLNEKGFQTRLTFLDDEDRDKEIRVAFLRSDAMLVISGENSLRNKSFYTGVEALNKNKFSKPLINVVRSNSLEELFESIYSDDNVDDDLVLLADDYKTYLESSTTVLMGFDDNEVVLEKLLEKGLEPLDKGATPSTVSIPKPVVILRKPVKKEEPVEEEPVEEDPVEETPAVEEAQAPKTDEELIREKAQNDFNALNDKIEKELEEKAQKKAEKEALKQQAKEEKEALKAQENKALEEAKVEPVQEVKEEAKVIAPEPVKVELPKKEILKDNPDSFKKAVKKYQDEEYNSAYQLFKETAANPIAMEYIGYCNLVGRGCDKNTDEAFKWYYMAVEAGNDHAKCGLADCYYYGYGTTQSYDLALKYYEETQDQDENVVLHLGNIYYYSENHLSYEKAFNYYNSIFECGIPQVYHNLGTMYLNGEGVALDYISAAKLYKKASDLGYSPATNDLGCLTKDGIGIEQNYAEAFRLFTEASKDNIPEAFKNLGDCYLDGIGTKSDAKKAAQSYKRAANLGSGEGAYELAHMFDMGDDIDISEDEAIKWYQFASDLGNPMAETELARHYYFGYGVKKDNEKAFDYYKMAAEKNYAPAMYELARCYHNGVGTEYSEENALVWYQKSAELDNIDALLEMGKIYENGYTVEQNIEEAFKCYNRANELGNPKGLLSIGKCYLYGIGIERNVNKAFETFKKAADLKYPEAQALYGDCFFNGTGTLQNYREAVKYYKIGIRGKDPHAFYAYARCCELGVGGAPKNMKEAVKNYREAADLGDDDACYELGDYLTNSNNPDSDFEEGFTYFESAAQRNYTPAIVRLAMCYYNGIGIDPDKDYAHDLGVKARDLGNPDASDFLKNYFNE